MANITLNEFRIYDHALSPADIRTAAATYLPAGRRVELTVVPEAAPAK